MPRKGRGAPPEPVDVQIGRKLKMRRLEIGMSQTDLGAEIGTSFQQVQKYERGKNRISASRLQKAMRALGVPMAYFFADLTKYDAENRGDSPSADAMIDFLLNRTGMSLIRAFNSISDPKLRKQIVDLVDTISKRELRPRSKS